MSNYCKCNTTNVGIDLASATRYNMETSITNSLFTGGKAEVHPYCGLIYYAIKSLTDLKLNLACLIRV